MRLNLMFRFIRCDKDLWRVVSLLLLHKDKLGNIPSVVFFKHRVSNSRESIAGEELMKRFFKGKIWPEIFPISK